MDERHYSHSVKKTLGLVLVFNWAVALVKLAVGYLIKSVSLIADGYHSFADGSSNIIGLLGMRIAGRPRDEDHPYGHKKYETLASVFIGFLLILICFHVLQDSLERLRSGVIPRVSAFAVAAVIGTLGVNIAVMFYEQRKGQFLGSDILIADSLHTRADILISFSVLISFIGVKMGLVIFDTVIALLIVVFIAFSAYEILRHSSRILCDTAAIERGKVEELVLSFKGVRACHRVRTRGRHDDIHIDLHILVDDQVPILAAHDLSSRIEEKIKERLPGVTDVIVHLEPLSSERSHHGR